MQNYKIIELRNYDVLMPFICQKCGSCCRGYVPQIPLQNLPKIAECLNKPIDEIEKLLSEAYLSESVDSNHNCIFLDNANQCSIYAMRPEPCQDYPLVSMCGNADVDCGGYLEFQKVIKSFMRRKYAAVWEQDSYKKAIRKIPENQLTVVWKIFLETKPSNSMIEEFVKLNELSDFPLKKHRK